MPRTKRGQQSPVRSRLPLVTREFEVVEVFRHLFAAQGMPPAPEPSEAISPEKEQRSERKPLAEAQYPASPDRVWTDIVTAGVSLLEKLGQALASAGTAPQDAAGRDSGASAFIVRDAKTGRPCLQLPLPDPETLRKISDVLAALAKGR